MSYIVLAEMYSCDENNYNFLVYGPFASYEAGELYVKENRFADASNCIYVKVVPLLTP